MNTGLLGRILCQWSVAAVVQYAGGENAGKQEGKSGDIMFAMSFHLHEGEISKMEVNGI